MKSCSTWKFRIFVQLQGACRLLQTLLAEIDGAMPNHAGCRETMIDLFAAGVVMS